MANPTRVLLLNTHNHVTREEINLVDRLVGEDYFQGLNLQYANHFIAEGQAKLAASWIVPTEKMLEVIDLMKTKIAPLGYEVILDVRLTGKTVTKEAHYS